ncbi:hypothetical protein H9P43_003929 [Blastocladiella emersonii ATCC 22665]|nr:hypothetical protein H9P43_003929 [Blastocladiella emersonii ATCC 22665]
MSDGAAPVGELLAWQERAEWNPLDFTPGYLGVNSFLIFHSILVIILNGMVVSTSLRNASIMNNAANALFVVLCITDTAYGVIVFFTRIILAAELQWSRALCEFNSGCNTFFVTAIVAHLLCISGERFLSVVLFKPMSRELVYLAIGGAYSIGIANLILHSVGGSKSVISTSGLYCYPSYEVYALIIHKLRASYKAIQGSPRSESSADHTSSRRDDSVSQVSQLRHAPSTELARSPGNQIVSSSGPTPNVSQGVTSVTSTGGGSGGGARSPSPLLITGTAVIPNGSATSLPSMNTETASIATTATTQAGPSKPQMKQSRKTRARENQIQRKIAMRGVMTLFSFSFTLIPFVIGLVRYYITGNRTDPVFDVIFVTSKFFSETIDPLIILTMDPRIRKAVFDVFMPWLNRFNERRARRRLAKKKQDNPSAASSMVSTTPSTRTNLVGAAALTKKPPPAIQTTRLTSGINAAMAPNPVAPSAPQSPTAPDPNRV